VFLRKGKAFRKKIIIKELALILVLLAIPFFVLSDEQIGFAPLTKTGQITCYDDSGNSINCTGTGQDGEYQKGVSWPTPRFADHGNGTVTDNLTGLMWTKDAQQIKGTMKWSDALTACNDLHYAGYTDWRLPNVKELLSLIDYREHDPALPLGHPFDNVQIIFYWSSTNYTSFSPHAWGVYLYNGYAYNYYKSTNAYVWSVRDGN
jgi:hypothetical protein